jgi:putative transposase
MIVGMATSASYAGFRFPIEVISHGVWLYYRFALSFRDVSELMLACGVEVSHETIRQWSRKFGQDYANGLRRRRPQPGDKWHLDEGVITINGEKHYLWRAVDQDGVVLDVLVVVRSSAPARSGPGCRRRGSPRGASQRILGCWDRACSC